MVTRKSTVAPRSRRPKGEQGATAQSDSASDPESEDRAGAIPEFIRRATALGLAGFFSTEEAVRKALGDTLPKDWIDFASQQSERTREELLERFSGEFGRVMRGVDLVELAEQLLEGRTLEVRAQIRLGERAPRRAGSRKQESRIDLSVATESEDDG